MVSLPQIALIPPAPVVVASCSSGSSKSTSASTAAPSSTAAPATKASYIATINVLCRTMNSRVAALGDPGSDLAAQADLNDKAIAITAEMLGKIRAVRQPAGDSDTLSAIYAKVDTVLTDARSLSTALRARDQTAAQTVQTNLNADSKTAKTARTPTA